MLQLLLQNMYCWYSMHTSGTFYFGHNIGIWITAFVSCHLSLLSWWLRPCDVCDDCGSEQPEKYAEKKQTAKCDLIQLDILVFLAYWTHSILEHTKSFPGILISVVGYGSGTYLPPSNKRVLH